MTIQLVTRKSALAMAQANMVADMLRAKGAEVELLPMSTKGDKNLTSSLTEIGGKGLFVSELEEKLLSGEADIAVHSSKDLPYKLADGLSIEGVPAAASPVDCLVTRVDPDDLPEHPVIGTSSPRRFTEIKKFLPGAVEKTIRGNVETRLNKLRDPEQGYDATLLAKAGLDRLGIDTGDLIVTEFESGEFTPAACQGIMAVECRTDNTEVVKLLHEISDPATRLRFTVERYVLEQLGADCSVSIGMYADITEVDGNDVVDLSIAYKGRRMERKFLFQNYRENCEAVAAMLLDETGLKGSVTLVGAGCGPDLITVKGLKAVQKADVLVYDNLIDVGLLSETKEDCKYIYVGKREGRHSMKQEEINKVLVAEAKAGNYVVRLKGGDSFVFGRGGEEIREMIHEDIPYDVIPGITSSVAVPENAGVPVTHRGVAQSFTVITGHTATSKDENYEALAKLEGTLVFLMGLKNTAEISAKLIANGKDPKTPACVLCDGFRPGETHIFGFLDDIAVRAEAAHTPAILVVGETVKYNFATTRDLPLKGVSVTVTGSINYCNGLKEKLVLLGATVERAPFLSIATRKDLVPEDLTDYKWMVFTSANGIETFFETVIERGIDLRCLDDKKIACIGKASNKALGKYGFRADFVPEEYTGEELGKSLSALIKEEAGADFDPADNKLILLRAKNGSPELVEELEKGGMEFTDVPIYDTRVNRELLYTLEGRSDYTVFASGSGVKGFFENGGKVGTSTPLCIGPTTEKALKKYLPNAPKVVVAKEYSGDGVIQAILEDLNK